MKKVLLAAAAVLVVAGVFFWRDYHNPAEKRMFLMDTFVSVTAYGRDKNAFVHAAETELKKIDSAVNAYNTNSALNTGGMEPWLVGLVSRAAGYGGETGGAFDITLKPVSELWNFNAAAPCVPSGEAIAEALTRTGYQKLICSGDDIKIPDGMALDLGGVAKGYACDVLAELAEQYRLRGVLLDLGGNVLVYGSNPSMRNGEWRVGIAVPFGSAGEYFGFVKLDAMENANPLAVVTSGIYQRNFTEDGVLYHHILDPQTGWPVQNELASATVLCESGERADAYATAILVLGREKGLQLAERADGMEAVLVSRDGRIWLTPGLLGRFEITDGSFRLVDRE